MQIGVLPEERKLGQTLRIELELEFSSPPRKDTISETVDYGAVIARTKEHLCGEGKSFQLIEFLAADLSRTLLEAHSLITAITTRVRKSYVPIAGYQGAVEAECHMGREELPNFR